MRTNWTGVGTALVTPFTQLGRPRRSRPSAGSAAGRSTPASTFSCRAARRARVRRSPTPSASAIVEILVDEANGAGAGARRRRRLQHARGHSSRRRDAEGRRVRPALGDALLQQADAGRAVPALPRDRREHAAADRRLQRAGPDRRATSSRRRSRGSPRSRTSSASRKHPATSRRCATSAARVPADFIVLSGDDAITLPLMAIGGRGVISVASNEIPAEMVQMVEAAERGDFAAARAIHSAHPAADAGQLRRGEPGAGQGGDGGDGPARGGRTVCRCARRGPSRREKILERAEGARSPRGLEGGSRRSKPRSLSTA